MRFLKFILHWRHFLIGVLFITSVTFGLMYIFKKPVIKIKEKIVEVQVEKPIYIDRLTGEKIESYWYISYDIGGGYTSGFYSYKCNGDKFN